VRTTVVSFIDNDFHTLNSRSQTLGRTVAPRAQHTLSLGEREGRGAGSFKTVEDARQEGLLTLTSQIAVS
jgi:hypothetical protein